MIFGRSRKKALPLPYNSSAQVPALRCSICTGEQTLGFKDKDTGKFHEYMLIRSEEELKDFMSTHGLTDIEKIY